jgi:ABC-2 type transport system ATP-binding protein
MLSDVEALCDRVGVVMSGKVVKIGELGKLFEEIHTDYEMLLKGVDEKIIKNLSDLKVAIEHRAGFIVLRFDEDIKAKVFQVVSDSGADIVSLHPLRKSLEGLFVEEAKKDVHLES